MSVNLITYILSFVGIWIGSGIAIRSVEKLSRILRISSFVVSFLVLGLFTSVSELSVGVNSIIAHDPEIFVGNLIGASIVLFILVIPLLAIVGNKIKIAPEFQGFNLPMSLIVVAVPVLLAIDGQITQTDSIISVGLYGFLAIIIEAKKGITRKFKNFTPDATVRVEKEILKIIFGLVLIFIASKFVVNQTLYFADILKVSPFLVSLIVISIGTNVPELSLVARSVFMKDNEVAFGDYIGSAAFNTFLIGFLTIINGGSVPLNNSYLISLLFLIAGLVLFYHFARTKNSISRLEGLALLFLYALFLFVEVVVHRKALGI